MEGKSDEPKKTGAARGAKRKRLAAWETSGQTRKADNFSMEKKK